MHLYKKKSGIHYEEVGKKGCEALEIKADIGHLVISKKNKLAIYAP